MEIRPVEDANLLLKMTQRLKPGVLENVFEAFQIPNDGSRRRYTLRGTLGGPGDAVETTMNAFYRHLKSGSLHENG